MIKNPLPFTLIILSILTINIYSQDFNLLNPSNEMYLFSAYDEGSNAFRYNPAVLGLNHKLNVTINTFLLSVDGSRNLGELDLAVNSGMIGFAFRHQSEDLYLHTPYYGTQGTLEYIHGDPYKINTFSLGFGGGNKKISAGFLIEYQMKEIYGPKENFDNPNPKFKFGLGVLFRPNNFISAAFTYKNNEALSIENNTGSKMVCGLAIRPLRNDRLTLMGDFAVTPRVSAGYFKYNSIKAGADIKILPGIHINANFLRINDIIKNDMLTIGFTIESPNTSVRYSQSLSNTTTHDLDQSILQPNSFEYKEGTKYKYVGSSLSLSYSTEKHESIIPERKKVIEITLSGSLQDYTTEDVFFGLLGKGKRSVHEVIADIDYAATDPSVKGILLRIYPLSTGRLEINAQMEELTNAIERFKAKNKKVTAYIVQDCGPAEYYIATFANDIVLPPEALLFYGLSINVFNYKQFLEKYGIELQNLYAGKYKLTFQGILDSSTAEGKEVIERILDIVYDKMMQRIISVRNISMDDYMKTKISEPMTGRDALRIGLVDKLGWYEDAKKISEDATKTSNVVKSLNRSIWDNGWSEPEEIAIVGVYASMTTGESQSPPPISIPIPYLGGGRSTGSETVVRQLEDAFANPKVKVVILRVDSGGGSVLASAEINAAIIRLKGKYKKPFYVSMGGSAASGGYYVSCNADKIFCDELTVTGSIGVFTSRPNADSLLAQQKLKVENFKRGENSDITSYYKKLTPAETEIIQGIIDYYYERFIDAISEGRKLSREEVEQVAQGHVWLGTDALDKKLIDQIGGLYDAVSYAKKKAGIGSRYKLVYYSVPGGESVQDVITASVVKYLEGNVLRLNDLDGTEDNLEIKY